MVTVDQLNDLAGRVEALGRMILHLTARLEDAGLLDGPSYTDGLRQSIVLQEGAGILMNSAQEALIRVSKAIDEAREWRKFRRQAVPQRKVSTGHRQRAA